MTPASIVGKALAGTGIDLVASCSIEVFDLRAPVDFRSHVLRPSARGVVVAGSSGPALWRAFRASIDADPARWDNPHPYDSFVGSLLSRADEALTAAGIGSRRFDAAFHADVRIDFAALGQLVRLGSPSPFGLLIHEIHGPWWALRGAWLVDADVDSPSPHRPPCAGCAAPCVGGWDRAGDLASATPEVRARCIVGQASRYDEDQIAFHYDRARTLPER